MRLAGCAALVGALVAVGDLVHAPRRGRVKFRKLRSYLER
jgi:hypothetical protein